ncbi:hypothetical protein [Iningainema tapete]|uniref:Uncharacterized protein n=1 Tax=Iningainema tapete BLCC-T55 TaxID=2748662 RepID=A0A8J6XI51_9CYAN|nr:hypothetical protein [Iningainema tapete]MBD2773680.1 hypothetical protein [Iningainema tapete BLCC-T55]
MNIGSVQICILLSALVADVVSTQKSALIAVLANMPDIMAIAPSFNSPRLMRELTLAKQNEITDASLQLDFEQNQVIYQGQTIGRIQILYKYPLPGELQARLAIESAIDRFLEYLQKQYQIVVLDESDRHVKVFIPNQQIQNFTEWEEFLKKVAFSAYGYTKHQLPGLVQTFIVMLNAITLSGRGFSTLDVPILTQEQSNVLAAWYYAVIRDVRKRQVVRQQQINDLEKDLANLDLNEKERKSKAKDLQDKQAMQAKEAQKYVEYFHKSFGKNLEEQNTVWQELKQLESKLAKQNLTKSDQRKLQKQQEKLREKLVFSQESIQQKQDLFNESKGDPFEFVQLDEQNNPENFKDIRALAKNFTKMATDQINSTRGDIFTQCITEMYRLLETKPSDPLPQPLLTEQPVLPEVRSPGDDSKEFCYSCGVALDPKTARWQVLRFMFEKPSQRRQSASSEGRPHICASCSALAFASPLKVTDESVILRLEPADSSTVSELKIKDYIRMLTNKQMHLSAGRYLILTSDRTNKGELASQKLGQVQYAIAKAASLFPVEVLADFLFSLITQGSQPIHIQSRHLIFIKGLMDSYNQSIINAGKEINMTLGDAVRYVQQDLPYLADYTLTKVAQFSDEFKLEQVRERYWRAIQKDLDAKGVSMGSDNQLSKRARLYRDVAALTGLTYAFAQSLESTAKKAMKQEDVEREVSKLIEKVDDAVAFCYYATLGDETKKSVQARLYQHPDNYFIYEQVKKLMETLSISNRQEQDEAGKIYLTLYADDVLRAYTYFAEGNYIQPKDWNELTYQLKLSLYTRFPELVRKLKSTSEK